MNKYIRTYLKAFNEYYYGRIIEEDFHTIFGAWEFIIYVHRGEEHITWLSKNNRIFVRSVVVRAGDIYRTKSNDGDKGEGAIFEVIPECVFIEKYQTPFLEREYL